MAAAVPGHIGSKALLQAWTEPTRWSSFLAYPDDVIAPSPMRQSVENVKRKYLCTTSYLDSTLELSYIRQLGGIFPAAALLARKPGLSDLFKKYCKPAIGVSYVLESFLIPTYWICGSFLKDFAKQRYFGIAALSLVSPASWAMTALVLDNYGLLGSLSHSLGKMRGGTLEKISLCGYVTGYVLFALQRQLENRRYEKKAQFYRSDWFCADEAGRKRIETKLAHMARKIIANKLLSLECLAKAIGLLALRIVGFKAPAAVVLLEGFPFAATALRRAKIKYD